MAWRHTNTGPIASPVARSPGWISLVLMGAAVGHLIDNAVKYSPPAGVVRVEVENDERTVSVTVHDEGPRILPEDVPQFFTRFFRGDPARPRAEGSGLGLSIAKAGGDAHGGLLEPVRASPGAAFRLTLPATGAGRS